MATRSPASNRLRGAASRRSQGSALRGDRHRRRRAIASLELVMALPVILLLLVGLLTLGSAGTAMTMATVQARNDAWRARTEASAGDTALKLSSESTTQTLVTRSATKQGVAVSPSISLAAANPEHTVMGGAWDHRDLAMDSPPHFDLYARLGLDLASDLTDIESAIGALQDLLTGGQMSQAQNWIKDLDSAKGKIMEEAGKLLENALATFKAALTNLQGILDNLDPTELLKKIDIKKQIDNVKKKIEAIEKAGEAL